MSNVKAIFDAVQLVKPALALFSDQGGDDVGVKRVRKKGRSESSRIPHWLNLSSAHQPGNTMLPTQGSGRIEIFSFSTLAIRQVAQATIGTGFIPLCLIIKQINLTSYLYPTLPPSFDTCTPVGIAFVAQHLPTCLVLTCTHRILVLDPAQRMDGSQAASVGLRRSCCRQPEGPGPGAKSGLGVAKARRPDTINQLEAADIRQLSTTGGETEDLDTRLSPGGPRQSSASAQLAGTRAQLLAVGVPHVVGRICRHMKELRSSREWRRQPAKLCNLREVHSARRIKHC
ncbi:unnamed protein product [Protopolystoma xenopodis]|uniref:Uncharacterized protein n=1 Tax=Protopolystoma xenopodis TaxID=117903 RepID=A0A3S5B994_9PLAT|nr:unnamed protein product [Protopolystoma xenopodis]